MFCKPLVMIGLLVILLVPPPGGSAAELWVGTAVVDITPTEPVAVSGQFHLRIAKTIETPVTANVIALESRGDGLSRDVAIMVSCDPRMFWSLSAKLYESVWAILTPGSCF